MKYFKTFILSLFVLTYAYNQNIPNGGFESWQTIDPFGIEEPDNWFTSNFYCVGLGIPGNATKSTEAYSGSLALKLEAVLDNQNIPVDGTAACFGKLTSNPQKLKGFYKTQLIDDDVSGISFFIYDVNKMAIGGGEVNFDQSNNYQYFEADLEYFMPDLLADTFTLTVYTDVMAEPSAGTSVWIDDLSFELISGVDIPLFSSFKTRVYPIPSTDKNITFEVPILTEEVELNIFDNGGKKLKTCLFTNVISLDIPQLSTGNYYFQIKDKNEQLLDGGKFLVL